MPVALYEKAIKPAIKGSVSGQLTENRRSFLMRSKSDFAVVT
jgi:hypothetical protein